MITYISNLPRALLAPTLAALALSACDSSTIEAVSSGSSAVTPGTATITSLTVSADQATVDWQLSSGALAEQWRLYQNEQRVCSGEPVAVASSDNSTYQSGGCTTDLQSGSNSFYVQLCNFDSSGSSLCSQSISEVIDYQEPTELGTIYLQDIPNSTSDNQIYVGWLKEQGVNGDHWRIHHNDAQACSGNLLYDEDSFVQSAGCDITLEVGTNKFQAELCQAQPVGIEDICTYSAALSTTFSEDSARSLATPYVVDPEELLPAEYDTSIAWIKDTSSGSAGEKWSMSNNGSVVCEDTLASDASNASCVLSLVDGANLLQVRLCTDTATYSGASCRSSTIVTVEAFDPNPPEPGIIDITNNIAQLTYSPSLALEWRIVSGNDVSSWSVDLNGEQYCATSSEDEYYNSGYCLLDLALGDNIISVTGCNYGYENSESCTSSAEVSTEYVVVPGTPEITSSFPTTTYDSGHNLSWERFDGEAADYWLAMVNDTSKCSYDLPRQTPQSDSCTIQLDSGVNVITARLCISNNSGSAYCTDSAAEQVELLAPVPAHPEISTPAQTIADDIILLEWSKSSGDNGSYWSVINNNATVSACSDRPLLSSGSSQSGDCNLPLELGANVVSVHLCNNNAAGTSSCTASDSVTIIRESAPPELTSATSATSAENNSAVFYTATVSDNDSSATQISFSLGGTDGSLFSIDSSGGLAFTASADYESPQDADGDNLYQLSITVTDQTSLTDQLDLSVSVTNINDVAPEFSSAASVSVVENSSGVIHSAQATDAEGDNLAYYLSGADASHFSLNSSSGELAFLSSLDYESPQDQDRNNIYQLDLIASDSAHSTVQAFSVELSDSNDESPQATSLQSIALDLSSISLGVTIYTVTASDPDAGDQFSYSHSGADASHFSLDSNSGDLAFIVLPSGADSDPLDADGDGVYQLDISISDLALNSSSFALTVVVADDVGMYPQFDLRHDSASISENSSASFYTAVAVDPEGEGVAYSLSGVDSSHFAIDSSSGELRPIAPLDYENPLDSGLDNNYSLTILASDPVGNQSQQTLDVLVSNANDNEPSFSAPSASVSVVENHTTSVYSADASDADGDSLIYGLSGTDAGHFSIDSSSGVLAFSILPDYENPQDSNRDNTYELTLTASDSASSAEQSLTVTVEDSNDNSPSFGLASDSLSVSENGDTLLYTALATDADAGDQVSYSLVGADASHFSLDPASGALSSLNPFDFENPLDANSDNIYELEIIASDGSNTSILTLSVLVSNLNDNLPSFALESDSLSVNENTSGIIYTAVATDLDGTNSLAYSLQGADANDFSIDPASGSISFITVPDFEQPRDSNQDNQYELEIRASDGINSASLDLEVIVSNVNDITPVFAYSSYSVEFTENATGTIYTAVASDSEGDSITYSIQGTDASYFSIDSASGALAFHNAPDFENPTDQDRDNHYQLDIAASDGANSTSLALTVAVQDINDNTPSFAADSESVSVSENTSATIYTATAADPDAIDSLAYSLSGADAHLFSLNSSSGTLAFSSAPDFESPTDQDLDNRYQLDIAATDGTNSASIALTVVVEDSNDNAPSFALASHSLDVTENTSGTIYTAAASDPDAIDSLTYSLQGTDAHNFTIHSSSGALAFYSAPDYEQPTDQNGDQRYHLDVKASDGAYSAILGITVEVSNLNDNTPSFAAASESFELPESSSGKVYTAAAADLDGDAITYSISGTDSSFFTINSSSGALNLASALDFESPQDQDSDNTYELEIAASDGVSSASLALSIELSDVNDNAPSFAQSTEALTVPENSSGIFYTATASDLDVSDSLSYSLTGSDVHHFSINANSGELAIVTALDFENPLDQGGNNVYEFSVSVSDGAHSAALGLTITVEDRNDNGPSFAQISDTTTVAENSSGLIYTASASDPDGDPITYSLGGADASHFSLDASSGALSLPNTLDFESPLDQNSDNHYQLEISADDGGSSTTLSLTVELSDVNDNSPSFATPSDSITVAENTSTSFYTATASDPDATASLSYSLSGADASLFTLDPASGALAFRSAPDFDNPLDLDKGNDYELDIGVSDGANSATLKLTVNISNVNDSTPVFTSTPSQVAFSEASSASVYTAQADDPDADSITYSVVGIDASSFSMDSSSGELSFRNQPDFESPQDQDGNNDYELEIQASDGLNSTSFDLIIIVEDANDNAPSFTTASDSLAVFENNSSIIYTATASDPDATASLSYSLAGLDASHFSINASSGALNFAPAPDFENPLDQGADNEYQLTISVSDGQHSATLDLLVQVEDTNDNPPVFSPTSASASVPENTSGVVYTAQATDLDVSASITYSFSASSGDSSLFALNSSSGAVSLLNPLDREQPIDSDSDNAYQLPITASDGIYSASLDLTISISDANDNPPSFDPASESLSVSENSSGVIYTAAAVDPDSSAVLSYSLLSGLDASHFALSTDGALSFVTAPDFDTPLDQDGNNAYELAISVSDGLASASLSLSVVVVDANDNAPFFALAADSVTVSENTTSSVYVAAATDPDAIDTITYSLSGSDKNWLSIDPSGGAITFVSPPDYEAPQDSNQDNTYELVINASDGTNSASQELNVSVSNLSDSTPIFSVATDSATAAENSSGVVYTALATDPDGDSLSYSINGSDASPFSIDSTSGALSFVNALDFESPQDTDQDNTYELNISASDGISAVSASLELRVSVTDVNDNKPQFSKSSETIFVFEDDSGTVYTADATDPDISDSLTYSISGTDASLLSIDSASGALSFKTPPDYENPSDTNGDNVYELSITASDGVNSAKLSLKATVINLNDSAPRFASMNDSAVADENSAASFYKAVATDPESSSLSYGITGGDAALFSIDSASGAVAFQSPPDFEIPIGQYADNSYEFNITADDGTYLGEMILTVTVADLNDNAPSFTPDTASATLAENSTAVFYQAAADDPDTVGALTYSIAGTDSTPFTIDPASGELSATTGLDFEQPSDADLANTYEFEITAFDGINSASANLALTVAVSNVNDTAPTFSVATESITFTENDTSIVYTAVATDPEGDIPSYSVSGTDSSNFTIDSASGALSFKTPPDFEAATDHNSDNTYELNITASDGVNSASLALTVAVQDINDNTPSFAASNATISVGENNASSVYTAAATDADSGDILSYSISGTDSALFAIDPSSGALAFQQAPDFEAPSDSNQDNTYELNITASDGSNQGSQALTITVSNVNEPLSFTTTGVNLSTAENNTSFAHIVEAAVDEDQGQPLSYQLGGADQSAFSLDSATRALSFANTPDYEKPVDQDSNNAYQIDIIASDGEYEATQSIAIAVTDLNDEAPQFTSLDLQTVDYTLTQVGDIIYTAQATDADLGDQVTYTLGGSDAGTFDFSPSTGELSFNTLPAVADFPTDGSGITYSLSIAAIDLVGNSTDLALTVKLLDDTGTAPTFAQDSVSINVDENIISSVYTAQATDIDVGDTLSYSISGTDSSLFTIGSSSGELSFKTAPDYENPSDDGKNNTYDLTISATDSMAKQAHQSLTIAVNDLNDNSPNFDPASHSFSVAENTSDTIYTAQATDADASDSLSYSLSGADSSLFSIASSGALSFQQAPDYETPLDQGPDNNYALDIIASDGTNSATLALAIEVTNLNDNAPAFAADPGSINVDEGATGSIYTASATDLDGEDITYSLAGTDSDHFTIDSSNGELSLASALDYETPQDHNSNNDYELEITASDGANANSTTLTLTVLVQDLNDNSPSFSSASETIQVPENTSGTIYTALATDLDATAAITYSISGTDSALLQIGASSGALSFQQTPDFENPQDQDGDNFYELSIIASDSVNSASLALTIEILNTSEQPPEISQIIGGDQAIDFTFDDFGTSEQLSIYRFTDDACSTAELASDHTQCYASDDSSSDTARLDFSGALASADYQVNDSGLRAGQRYYYQIWAAESSSASDIGVWSQRYSAMTWPAADVGTTLGYDASATGGTQVVLSFVAPSSGDDDYYHFLRHSDPDCASYAAGTALNRADYSDWSALVDPLNGGLCSGLTELSLSGANLHAPSGGASDSHTDSGLARGTTYYYLLRTVNYSGANGVDFSTRSGASATSNQLQWTTVPPAPAADDLQILSSPAVAADQISIAFASVAGASSYKLVRYIPANCSVADQQIASVESCSASAGYAEQDFNSAQSAYTDSGLQAGSTYAYQYRAINAAGSSQYSPAVSATTTFDKPSISLTSSVSLSDANVITVSWSASSGIDSYSILGSSNESCLISATASADPQASAAACAHSINRTVASSTTSTDIDQHDDSSALASGSYYYFAAAAVSSSGSSDYSDVASAITAPASPNVISLSPGYQQVEVAWDVPAGSAENVLYRYTESTCSLSSFPSNCGLDTGSYTFTSSIPNDAYIDDNSGNGLLDNQMYYYALQASNAGGARYTESASAPFTLTAPKTPDSLIASGERLAVQLRWGLSPTDADDGVAGYEILRSSSSTCYGSTISAYSDYASCPDAALFLFDYGSGEQQNEYQFSDSELDPSSGSEPLTGGSTYYYWIRSFYGSTNDAVYSASTSAPASATPILPAPTNLAVDAELSASGSSTDISIAWDEVASASGYVLYRTTSADCITVANRNTSDAQNNCADYQREELSGSSTTATTHSSLPSDTIYYYYVAAANSAVEGELSSALSTRSATVAPTITRTETYSNTIVRVEWDASSAYDATYHLYAYSGDASCNPFTAECPHESLTTISADGSSEYYDYAQQLEPGTHYNFKMLAITEYEQEDGTEDFVHGAISSAAATATTAANHPTITGHEYVDYDYFDLFVSIEGGLDSVFYYVLYTLDPSCSVNDVLGNQCSLGGALGYVAPASSIRLANYDFGVYYYVISMNSDNLKYLTPDEDTPPYLVPARPAQVELSVNATKNSSGNGTDIKIEWQQSSGVDGYVLYRTTSSGCITDSNRNDSSTKSNCDDYQRQEISGSSTTTTTHSNLPNDTIYHYSVATISNGSEGTLSESIATHTATTAPPIVDVITYNQSQIEVTWWANSAFETDYYIYAYSGDASCDPHAEVCPGEKLVSVAFDFSAEYTTVFTGLTPGTRYNFKAYSNVAYPQENGGTDYVVGYISETAEAKTNYTFANHPTITGHQENDDGDILLEFAIDGGTDDLTYYIFRTTNGECTTTEVVNSESKCTDRGTATATPEQNVIIHKVDDKDYYYHVISANPVGSLAWDDSTEPYYIPSYVVVKDIDVEMTHYVAHSNSDFIGIEFVAAEPIPDNNKWTLRMYPPLIENSEVKEYVLTNEQVADDDSVLAFQIKPKYYFQPHAFELYASRLDDTDFILLASFIVWDIQPPPLVAVEKNSDSNKYSEEKDFDIYILHYHDDFDISSVVGIETLKADITMIFTDADAVLCRPPYVPIVDMIYGNCPLVRSYTDWWDGSELLFNRVEGDTGNQLLHDVVVSNNETYQASQGLFQVYDITFAGTTPIYDDQDDPWSFFMGPYISSFTIDTDFGKYSLDYEEAFSYLSIELAFGEDEMAEFQVYGSSSSNALLPTPTLVLSPALLSQGLSAGSAYNSWDLHLLWEAINGINSYAIHEYSDSDCAYLLSAPELCGNYNLHSSLSPDFSHAFAAADMGSYFYYRLQAYDAAGNSSELGEQIAVHIPQALNDSGLGLDTCVVSDALSGAQDCASGRDASVAASAKVGSGSAGFDFSLLEVDADASVSSDSHCVHDNTTGLSWSSWSVPADDLASAAEPDTDTNATRSSATFAELATISLDACGYSDWSLPSIHELLSIADYNQTEAKIDRSFFTGFNSSQPSYWSASGHILDFSSGDISLEANASAAHSVLLVRADRRWGHDFGAERFQLVEHLDGNLSIHLVYDNHSQLHYAPCLAGQSYDPLNHSCTGTPTELDYIDSLNAYDSNSTWRQPNIKELIAILDPTHNLLPNPEYFPNPTSNSTSDSSTNSDSNSSASDSSTDYSSDIDSDLPYPAPIFILTPSSQSPDHITGRQLNPSTQSTTATNLTQLLNSYLIYEPQDHE